MVVQKLTILIGSNALCMLVLCSISAVSNAEDFYIGETGPNSDSMRRNTLIDRLQCLPPPPEREPLPPTLEELKMMAAHSKYTEFGDEKDSRMTVYVKEDFDKAESLEINVIRRNRGEARSAGVFMPMKGDFGESLKFHCRCDGGICVDDDNDLKTPGILQLEAGKGKKWTLETLVGEEFITLTFDDGASLWFKQPRGNRANRDRSDTWIRGGMGVLTGKLQTEQQFGTIEVIDGKGGRIRVEKRASLYPEQLVITRPRVDGPTIFDPPKDLDYSEHLAWTKIGVTVASAIGAAAAYAGIVAAIGVASAGAAGATGAVGAGGAVTGAVGTAVGEATIGATVGAVATKEVIENTGRMAILMAALRPFKSEFGGAAPALVGEHVVGNILTGYRDKWAYGL